MNLPAHLSSSYLIEHWGALGFKQQLSLHMLLTKWNTINAKIGGGGNKKILIYPHNAGPLLITGYMYNIAGNWLIRHAPKS